MTFASFKLCLWDKHALSPDPTSLTATSHFSYDKDVGVEDTMRTCLTNWGMPYDDVEEVRFHHHDEDCTFARPFVGPIIDRVYEGVPLELHLHLHFKTALERRVISRRSQKKAILMCRLEFELDFDDSTPFALHQMRVGIPAGAALEDIPGLLRTDVTDYLSVLSTMKNGKKLLDLRGGFCYPYWTRICCSSLENAWVGLEGRRLAVDTVADLFADPSATDNTLDIAVVITKEYSRPACKSWEEATFPHKSTGGALIRLRATDLARREPPCEHAIRHLATVLQYATFNDRIMMLKNPVFDFGDFSVDQGAQNGDEGIHGALNCTQHSVLKTFKSNLMRSPRVGSGVPFRPIYTFNNFDSAEFGLGVESLPTGGITLAIHFVENLSSVCDGNISSDDSSDEDFEDDRETPLDLPLDYVLIVDKAEQLDNLAGFIRNSLLKSSFASEPDAEKRRQTGPGKLFSKPLISQWTTALWAMPHPPGEMKLYHLISDGGQNGERPLLSFLNPKLVAEGDTRMYMEFHFLRKKPSQFEIWPDTLMNGEIHTSDGEEMAEFGQQIEQHLTRKEIRRIAAAGERWKQDQLEAKIKELEDQKSAIMKQLVDTRSAKIKRLGEKKPCKVKDE